MTKSFHDLKIGDYFKFIPGIGISTSLWKKTRNGYYISYTKKQGIYELFGILNKLDDGTEKLFTVGQLVKVIIVKI